MIEILESLKIVNEKDIYKQVKNIDDSKEIKGVILDTREFDLDKYLDLSVISRIGVGIDNIDLQECERRNIKVFITPCQELIDAVAEFTIMQMLNLIRKNIGGRNLRELKIGIIGFGRIGEAVSDILLSIGCVVYGCDKKMSFYVSNKEYVLKESDIITIHVSGNEQIIGEDELKLMKGGSYIINTAREKCIDEKAILKALKSGKLAGVATDVNLSLVSKNKSIENKIIRTPHIASMTYDARKAMEALAVENLLKGLKEI